MPRKKHYGWQGFFGIALGAVSLVEALPAIASKDGCLFGLPSCSGYIVLGGGAILLAWGIWAVEKMLTENRLHVPVTHQTSTLPVPTMTMSIV